MILRQYSTKLNPENNGLNHISNYKFFKEPVKIYINVIETKKLIYKENKDNSGIYLWHNNFTGDQYIGSAKNLTNRISCYFQPSEFKRKKLSIIFNAIKKYTLEAFSLVILEKLDKNIDRKIILEKEQDYIFKYNSKYNILKYTLLSNNLTILNIKYIYTEETKANFKGENNSFFGKTHTEETKSIQSVIKKGELNPMFGKKKSPEFIYHMKKDRSGKNNPMYGKIKSPETIKKLSKPIYIYDMNTKELIKSYSGVIQAKKNLKIGTDTLKKYILSGKYYKNQYILSYKYPFNSTL
jgi:group I intron endonuclease